MRADEKLPDQRYFFNFFALTFHGMSKSNFSTKKQQLEGGSTE